MSTTVLPVTSAARIFIIASSAGTFHGQIAHTTPSGV
ncbi:hypothetical protein ACVWVZ_002990 [Pseudomonas tolaasii]